MSDEERSVEAVREFAQRLVRHVRDRAISISDMALTTGVHEDDRRLQDLLRTGNSQAIVDALVPAIVDDTVGYLLDAIDNGELRLLYQADDGQVYDLYETSMGSFMGYYVVDDAMSWRRRYSQQRT